MNITRKSFLIILTATGVIAIVLLLSLTTLIEKNHDRIREQFQRNLGRDVKFDRLRLILWGGLGLAAEDLRIADDARFAATPLMRTQELRMHVRWLPLLFGKIVVDKFTLEKPEIQIIRNEEGAWNLSALAGRVETMAATVKREPAADDGRSDLEFLVTAVSVTDGTIDYIDRSSKEPVEIAVRKTSVDFWGIGRPGATSVELTAYLLGSPVQNISIGGQVGPIQAEKDWSEQPLDLQFRIDSLPLRPLASAVPLLREKIIELGVTGPLNLQARLSGNFARPRVRDLTLSGAFFGATELNTMVKGGMDSPVGSSWAEGAIQGTLTIDPVHFAQLKKIAWVGRSLPASLTSEGPLSVTSRFYGNGDAVQIVTLIKGEQAEIRYGNWLKKTSGIPAQLELNMEWRKDLLAFRDSTLTLHNLKMKLSGLLEDLSEPLLTVRLQTDGLSLEGWDKLLTPLSSFDTDGKLTWDLAIKKHLGPRNQTLDVRGTLKIDQGLLKDQKTGRGIDQVTGQMTFRGQDSQVENVSFRLASSQVTMQGLVPDLSRPSFRFSAHAAKLKLAEIVQFSGHEADEFGNISGTGELRYVDGAPALLGNFFSHEGTLYDILYRNLRIEISWNPKRLSFNNLAFQALSGTFRGDGIWQTGEAGAQQLNLATEIDAMNLNALLGQKFPRFKDHIEGQINAKARVRAESKNGAGLEEGLTGTGDSQIQRGTIKNFNVVEQVLSKVSGLPGVSDLSKSRLPHRYTEILRRRDTPFETLETAFTIEKDRIRADKVILTTPDYTVKGEGWIGFDKATKWNAALVLSAQFTRDLVREHRNVRYMANSQGKLVVPFQVEGTLPDIRAQPEMGALEESLKQGLLKKARERAVKDKDSRKKRK